MSVSEISGLENALEADPTAVEVSVADSAVGDGAAVTVTTEPENDSVSINALSGEPAKTFVIDAATGAIRTVETDATTGRNIPLTTGLSESAMTRQLVASGENNAIAMRPVVRDRLGIGGEEPKVQVIDPTSGEIVKTLDKDDVFDLDQTLREFTRKSLVDTSA